MMHDTWVISMHSPFSRRVDYVSPKNYAVSSTVSFLCHAVCAVTCFCSNLSFSMHVTLYMQSAQMEVVCMQFHEACA